MIGLVAAYIESGTTPVKTETYIIDGVEWEMKMFRDKDISTIDKNLDRMTKTKELVKSLGF